MALGGSTMRIQTGGGRSGESAAKAVRNLVLLAVSPAGEVNVLYRPSSLAGIAAAFDTGPLAEGRAKAFRDGHTAYGVPVLPSTDGDIGTVDTSKVTGAGTITPSVAPHKPITVLCTVGGTLGTMKVRFSLDGGVTYGDEVASVAGGTWVHRVAGTFCTLTFNAATYVATKTLTVGVDGVVTAGVDWVGTVTQASSPIDGYEVVAHVVKAGALGVAILAVSLDNKNSYLPSLLVPAGGVVVVPGTGLVLTCANSFTLDDEYSFLTAPPGFSTSDLTAAIDALKLDSAAPRVALLYVMHLASSAANAFSLGSTLSMALDTAFSADGFDWQGVVDCPFVGDTIISGGAAIADTADTETVIRTARTGKTFNRVSVFVGTHRMASALKADRRLKRPLGLALASVYVDTDPANDVSEVGRGPLPITELGRDERTAATSLHDIQLNVAQTRAGFGTEAYFAIESGGFGWRNLTVDADYQDAQSMRILNAMVAALRVAGAKYVGSRQVTNPNGTIEENVARAIDTRLDAVARRSTGLLAGGDFSVVQASTATASVDRSSQLGTAPRRLLINYSLQPLGFVSDVEGTVRYSGVLTLEG